MADQFVAEIRIFGFDYAPTGWAACNGQLMPISQNTALFSLLGTFYGGDGKTTFALPNFNGFAPVGQGQSTTGSDYSVGQTFGVPSVTLLESEMPAHTHGMNASRADATSRLPASQLPATGIGGIVAYGQPTGMMPFDPRSVQTLGNDQPHNNMQPYLAVNFCIALQGIFPPRG
jgi:microcystin-dependent protein